MNTTTSRYVKPNLLDTVRGTADPHELVRQWLEEAAGLLAATMETFEPKQARRLLALWQCLARVRPELISKCDPQSTAAALAGWATERGRAWAGRLPRFDETSWQQRAALLEDSYEEDWAAASRSALAINLLNELDDAQLAALALHRLGVKETDYLSGGDFSEPIERCAAWCSVNADTLLSASRHVQAVGLAMRPDLLEYDPELAVTALKFEAVLAAAEDAEDAVSLRPFPKAANVLPGIWIAFLKHKLERQPGHPGERLPVPLPLAAEPALLPPRVLWWQSPDRRLYRACLALPARPADDTAPLVVAFSTADDQPALDLAGQPVRLAGAAGTIGPDAKARWTLGDVRRSGNDLVLEVGPDCVRWAPLP